MIADLYDRNLYYPPEEPKQAPKKQADTPPLKLTVVNRRTLEQTVHSSKAKKKLTVGRNS